MTSYCLRFLAAFDVSDKQTPVPHFVDQIKQLPLVASEDEVAANRLPWQGFFREFGTHYINKVFFCLQYIKSLSLSILQSYPHIHLLFHLIPKPKGAFGWQDDVRNDIQ